MKTLKHAIATGFVTCFSVAPVSLAQNIQTVSPPPICETEDGFDDFDFWVGEWNVYSNDEARAFQGTNSITKHYNGCLLKEQWHGAQGGAGFSINYFNSVTNKWRQVWVANGYSIDYTGGVNEAGAMVLEGKIFYYRPDVSFSFRGIWTPQDDGTVIQHFDQWNPETEQWDVWFEGLYIRQDDDGMEE